MTVKADVRYVNSKRDKTKKVKKTTYKCEGSYVDIDGVPHRYHKRGFSIAEEAREWERTFLLKATNEVSNSLTYGDLYKVFKESKKGKITNRSIKDIDTIMNNHVLPYWKDISVPKINLKRIEEWQHGLLIKTNPKSKKVYANRYLESVQVHFKSVITYGLSMGYITDVRLNMFKLVRHTDEIKKEMLFWHPDEFMKFISKVDKLPYYALFNVLYWCGLRLGEALALTWKDIDFSSKTIHINKSYSKKAHTTSKPKTINSYRDVIMPNMCCDSLKKLYSLHSRYIGFDHNKLVFGFNKHLDDNAIHRYKNMWCDTASVKRIRIHDFRHSHVSLLINQGFNAFDIAKRLGHTVEMVNNVYGHWFTDAQQNMVDRLNDISKNLV